MDDINHLESIIEWYRRHSNDLGFKGITFSLLTANEEFIKLKDVRKALNITSML